MAFCTEGNPHFLVMLGKVIICATNFPENLPCASLFWHWGHMRRNIMGLCLAALICVCGTGPQCMHGRIVTGCGSGNWMLRTTRIHLLQDLECGWLPWGPHLKLHPLAPRAVLLTSSYADRQGLPEDLSLKPLDTFLARLVATQGPRGVWCSFSKP